MMPRDIWVVDDDESIRWVLRRALSRDDWKVTCFSDGESALLAGEKSWPDLIIADIRMPGVDGFGLLEKVSDKAPELPVIVMTAYSDLDTTVRAFAGGAYEYLAKPFDIDEVSTAVERALEQQPEARAEDDQLSAELLGESAAMQDIFRQIGRLSRSHLSVLVTGETGTGKELIARALHRLGPRKDGPFVALNTAAVPQELLESELFGHEKGAFTGAQSQHQGRFEQANGGTLFLDEIGDMPASLQTRLLRVLAEHQFYRVGGRHLIEVDVRVIAATHQDLSVRVADGDFREDLFHRLNVVQIRVPPLRERGNDVLLLARMFLARAAAESGLENKQISSGAEQLLLDYHWPGNVRELENLCRSLTVMKPGPVLKAADLRERMALMSGGSQDSMDWESVFKRWFSTRLDQNPERLMGDTQDHVQELMIRAALGRTGGRKEAAARLLGCGRNTLTRRMAALGMEER
ncbi:MAG: nitrogen regulation protein NR(I) [Xanthomonadales bacterium]|nr:nitrogen regulation protein NR(I) [Xanthomonadales bacterium]